MIKQKHTENLSLDPNQNYALYLPAIGAFYNHVVSAWEQRAKATHSDGSLKYPNRTFANLSPDAKELYFLNENNGSFHYNAALYSAGHAYIEDLNESQAREKIIYDRDKSKTIVVADSGGFQIAKSASGSSVSGFDWTNPKCVENDEIRLKILRWMEHTADYSMMLDVPTHTMSNERANKHIKSFSDCMSLTKYNADFFVKNRVPGATKILNVMQGRNQEEADIWWDTFKDYPFEGWAFGGATMGNISYMLRRLIMMRDGKYIDDRNWLHVLGTSRLSSSCILTEIQRAIRNTVNEKFTISYDSATAFVVASKGFVLTYDVFESNYSNKSKSRFSYLTHKMVETIDAVGSTRPFPFSSVPAKFLTVGDICCRDPKVAGTKTTWDSFSYALLMWHNLYRQISAIQNALRIYDMPSNSVRDLIPANLLEFKDLCKDIFISEKPFDIINKHKNLLTKLSGVSNSGGKSLLSSESSSLFSWDDNNEESDFDENYNEYEELLEEDNI